jgi:hypothetical protein
MGKPMDGFAGDEAPEQDWPLRAWGLALLGGLAGLLIHWITREHRLSADLHDAQIRMAIATFIGTGTLLFGFLIERSRPAWSVAFSSIGAALVALTIYWNGPFNSGFSGEPWRIVCALLSVAIAAPLFQSWRGAQPTEGARRWTIPYGDAHSHAWTNVVLWFAAWAFVGVCWAMALLLGELFQLIGLRALKDLLGKEWMILTLTGAALGAGIGLLRDRAGILGLLQRVVTTILAVLAPLLAVGLLLFLAAIPFTGLTPLWDATRSTSPILLSCVIGALCLTNAVIGDQPSHEARSLMLRGSVAALGVSMLPLGIIAAISTGSRIHQYGLTPDRLWAVIFTAIACAYGLAYLAVLLHRRLGAAPHLRIANLRLAIALGLLALLLATPLVNFGALSARDQVARLTGGRTSPDRFDWRALRFDFGAAGEAATRKLATEGKTPAIQKAAATALKAKNRYDLASVDTPKPRIDPARLIILPRGTTLPEALVDRMTDYAACWNSGPCVVLHRPGSHEAVIANRTDANVWTDSDGPWRLRPVSRPYANDKARTERIEQGLKDGKVEIRNVTRRQIFVDGEPVGSDFE